MSLLNSKGKIPQQNVLQNKIPKPYCCQIKAS
jgi:hypothetical protein